MHRSVALAVVAVALVLGLRPTVGAAQSPRLVIFEGFLSTDCGHCAHAGEAMQQLAQQYAAAGSPVTFVEQSRGQLTDPRQARFRAAYTGDPSAIGLPWTITDSGAQVANGQVGGDTVPEYVSEYKRLVDAELARAARADVQAYSRRVGDDMRVYLQVTNLATTLSAANDATVWALVYEDVDVVAGANLTGRYVRGVASQPLTSVLVTGATASFTLDVTPTANRPLSSPTWQDAVDWSKLHALAFVDYRPGGATGSYDMVQAGVAAPGGMTLGSDNVHFIIDSRGETTWRSNLPLSGPSQLVWTASADQLWLTVTPATFSLPAQVQVGVDLTGMPEGDYEGHLTFASTAADGAPLLRAMTVAGSYVEAYSVFVPVVLY
ncbi:MAG: BACON domain-containing protein [Anaerolineae bacterium]